MYISTLKKPKYKKKTVLDNKILEKERNFNYLGYKRDKYINYFKHILTVL
jgi:hypothetical protein